MAHHHRQPPATALYDFVTALGNLQDRIQALAAKQQGAAAPATRLGATWAFLKANRGNALLLVTFYSMATASVAGSIMSEHRLQSDRLLDSKEHQQLQQHIHRLERQVQGQQQVLDGLASDLQQQQHHHAGAGSSWWWRGTAGAAGGAGAVRQQLVQRMQRWKDGSQLQDEEHVLRGVGSSTRSSSSSSSPPTGQPQQPQEEEFGVKVGPLGRGFLI